MEGTVPKILRFIFKWHFLTVEGAGWQKLAAFRRASFLRVIANLEIQFSIICNMYCNFRKYAHPLHVKEGIITEKVFPVFSESYFGLVLA